MALLLLCAVRVTSADGTLSMRGVYYKERATRVVQPMIDGAFEVGEDGLATAHFLVDAITSASASSGAENSMPFTENRYEGGVSYTRDVGRVRVAGQGRYSTESDYKSLFGGLRAEVDLAQKNTVLGLGVGAGRDRISAAGAQGLMAPQLMCTAATLDTECKLRTYTLFASASQVVNRNAVVALTYDLAYLDGYQSNPYRMALTATGLASERHPTERLRQSYAASARYWFARPQTALIGSYRYYRDDWGVRGHTPEVRVVQSVSHTADATFRYRYHTQTRARFYQDRYETSDITAQRFLSDDVKLDDHSTHTIEAKLGVTGEAFGMTGRWEAARFEGILQYALLHPRFGNAVVAHVAVTIPFEY